MALAHLEGDAKGGQQLIAVKIVEGQEAAAGLEHEARIYEYLNRAGIGISLRVPRYYGLFDQVSPRSPNRAHALVVSLDLGKPIEDLKPYESVPFFKAQGVADFL